MNDFTDYSSNVAALLYHRIGAPKLSSLVAGQYVAPMLFRSELDHLDKVGWQPISLGDIAQSILKRRMPEGNRYCVTFDDGYLSVYEHAYPILKARGIPATVFVVVDSIGGINDWDRRAGDMQESMMTAEQVREISDNGIEIGSHTLTHPHLNTLSDDVLKRELEDSKHKLEDIIGKQVTSFSYPYGEYDKRVVEAVSAAGYECATTTKLKIITPETEVYEIPRVNVRWNALGPLLMRKIDRAVRATRVYV